MIVLLIFIFQINFCNITGAATKFLISLLHSLRTPPQNLGPDWHGVQWTLVISKYYTKFKRHKAYIKWHSIGEHSWSFKASSLCQLKKVSQVIRLPLFQSNQGKSSSWIQQPTAKNSKSQWTASKITYNLFIAINDTCWSSLMLAVIYFTKCETTTLGSIFFLGHVPNSH